MRKKKEWRMYGFVPYNISEIQKGIQFGHAVVEYERKYKKNKDFKKWAKKHKTFIILNGGTTRTHVNKKHQGGMQNILSELKQMGVKYATFNEPDLNNALTAIVFLVNSKTYELDIESIYEGVDEIPKEMEMAKWLKKFRLA